MISETRMNELRRIAEEILKKRGDTTLTSDNQDIVSVLQELNVYQIELEHQNEELQNAQLQLEKTRDRYLRLYHNAPGGYFTIDDEFCILEANETGALMLAETTESLKGKKITRFIDPDFQDKFYIHLRHVFETGEASQFEMGIIVNESKLFIHAKSIFNPEQDAQGPSCLLMFNDITDRVIAEKESHHQLTRFKEFAELLPQIIYEADPTGKILFMNEGGLTMLGYSGKDILQGLNSLDLLSPDSRETAIQTIKNRLSGDFSGSRELVAQRKDGSQFPILANVSFIGDKIKPEGYRGIWVDISPLKESQRQLNDSRHDLVSVLENIGDAFFTLEDEFIVTYFNQSAEKILGRKREEVLGKNLFDVFPGAKGSIFDKMYSKALKERVFVQFETFFDSPGLTNWYDVRAYPNQHGISVFFRTTTEQKEAEIILRNNEEKYRLLFENAGIGIGYYSPDGRIILYNEIAASYLKTNPSTLEGKSIKEIFPGPTGEEYMKRIQKSLKSKEILAYEDEVEFEEGKRWFLSRYLRIPGPDKKPAGVQIISNDITEIKKVQILTQRENSINKSLAALGNEVLRHDYSIPQLCSFISKIARELTGSEHCFVGTLDKTTQNVIGHSVSEMINKECKIPNPTIVFSKEDGKFPGLWGACLNRQEAFFTNCPENHPESAGVPTGHIPIKNFLTVPVIADGQMLGQISLANKKKGYLEQDLDVAKRIANLFALALLRTLKDEELLIAKEKAEESDKLKTTFLTNISHEIRTPMNGILGFSELLTSAHINPEKTQKYNSVIKQSGQQLLRIIDDILDISKISTHQLQLSPADTNVYPILTELYDSFQKEINRLGKKVKLSIKVEQKNYQDIYFIDGSRLKQILFYLLHNSVKFTNSGSIQFGYYQTQDNQLEFFVEDTGMGIPENTGDIIFEPFRQHDETLRRQLGGNGLGLAISKGIIDCMQGKIWYESNKHVQGTTFYFSIPIQNSTKVGDQDKNKPARNFDWKGKTILIVEDDEMNFEFLQEVLLPTGVDVKHAHQGKSAIEWIINHPQTNLVLLDIRLPDTTGYSVAEAIKQLNSRIPIIAQTAYAMPGDKEKALRAGCVEYISKPINRNRLTVLIDQHIIK